jgi:hypothetical protein
MYTKNMKVSANLRLTMVRPSYDTPGVTVAATMVKQ